MSGPRCAARRRATLPPSAPGPGGCGGRTARPPTCSLAPPLPARPMWNAASAGPDREPHRPGRLGARGGAGGSVLPFAPGIYPHDGGQSARGGRSSEDVGSRRCPMDVGVGPGRAPPEPLAAVASGMKATSRLLGLSPSLGEPSNPGSLNRAHVCFALPPPA